MQADPCTRRQSRCSKRIQEIDQVAPLLAGKADTESLVIKIHNVQQGGGRSIVEIGRPRGQSTQDGPFELADVGTVPAN
jgi:hypothetical protein